MKTFSLEWDKDLDINPPVPIGSKGWSPEYRTGWSVLVDGHCIIAFEPWLIVTVVKTLWYISIGSWWLHRRVKG